MTKRYIMIHHSLTEDSRTVSWGAIERYHREVKGWKDIGYHFGVEYAGTGYYALIGRAPDLDGAACKEGEMNGKAFHVCCVGNYDLAAPSPGMLSVLIDRIILPLQREHLIPAENIVAHRDYATYKSCPGTRFDMDQLRDLVRARKK